MSAWGPAVVLLIAVVLAYHLAYRVLIQERTNQRNVHTETYRHNQSGLYKLTSALDSATTLNTFNVHDHTAPKVRLQQAVKVSPGSYDAATHELLQCFLEDKIIAVDLQYLNSDQSGRVVDFCSGATAIRSGWIFRITDTVIVITPSSS